MRLAKRRHKIPEFLKGCLGRLHKSQPRLGSALMRTSRAKSAKAYLAATFVTAAAFSALVPASLPALSSAIGPATVAVRVGSVVEIGASLLAGVAAALLANRRNAKA